MRAAISTVTSRRSQRSSAPPVCCWRNWRHGPAIQPRDRDRFDRAMQTLVEHLDLLAKRELSSLKKICGVSEEDLADMIVEIRALNPKPGLAFGSVTGQPTRPQGSVRA